MQGAAGREAVVLVAAAIRARAAEADRTARTLAPDGPGPGRRFLDGTKHVAYQLRFGSIDELVALLEAGHAGALVFSIEILAALDAEAALPAAELLLSEPLENSLGSALARVLGACSSERTFRLLVDHPEVPYLRSGLQGNGWAGGVEEAWSILKSADFHARDLDPHARVRTLPALAYLLRHDRARAFEAAVALLDAMHANLDVSHMLHRLVPEGPEALLRDLSAAAPGARLRFSQRLGVKVLLERDPKTVVDTLGGEAFLSTPAGRPRLYELVQWLRSDTWAKAHDGGPRGWLAADPRFARLLAGLRADPQRELAGLARDLLATLPKELRPKEPKGVKTPTPVQAEPDPALLAELEAMREALERLVQHLRNTKYRFAAPKEVLVPPKKTDLAALARLEKKVVVPPLLAALWRTIGSVDLRGQDPRWPLPAYLGFPGTKEPIWQTDPLVIAPAAHVIGDALADASEPPFALHVAPDAVQKAAFSGGLSTIWLPQDGTDPTLEGTGQTLLAHLRHALAWGGFPGFATIDERPEAWLEAARAALAARTSRPRGGS